ncbi:sodium- and chloride-dependent glycine transporter 1-like [Saccoglossus kowalevskii]|uniref:Transporter n=1 Tax=Saccoglossus kowalevskii TaxID=10224 RepID=A0ABM0GMB6_SACKO|nr:PREDICTED: sodium- and chloride-dependent glycine transporter 2-like [Saccoglossus kowalevskii]
MFHQQGDAGLLQSVEMQDLYGPEQEHSSKKKPNDENPVRGNWSRKGEFILASLGYAVGLGNLWRFPYLCFKNGGATFLIPYFIVFFAAGIPIFFTEMALGQFSSLGSVSVWKLAPMFKGIGWAMVIISAFVSIYYNVVLSWALFYLFASFSDLPSLPWVGCGNAWNSDKCFDDRDLNSTVNVTAVRANLPNDTVRPTDEYFGGFVLETSTGVFDMGGIKWQLSLCLLLAWILVYLCIIRGIKSAGKVVYFTATFPYVLILVLVIRGCTLEGASDGIEFYIGRANWTKLAEPEVWKDAAGQVFYSLSAASGGLSTMASYNKFHNNVFGDAVLVAILNALTSLFAGFAIFSVLGNMAYELDTEVKDVVDSGPGLAFVAYPEALSRLPISPLWSVIFFFMLVTLGIDSMFVIVETVITALLDEFKCLSRKRKVMRTVLPILYCTCAFIVGLPHVTRAGLFWVNLMDTYASALPMVVVGIIECLVVTYVYGLRRYYKDLKSMLGPRGKCYWIMLLVVILIPLVIAPLVLIGVLIFYALDYVPAHLGGYIYPRTADVLGWFIACTSLAAIVLYIPYYLIFKQKGSFGKRFLNSIRPEWDWGPALNRFRYEAGYPLLPEVDGHGAVLNRGFDGRNTDLAVDVAEVGIQCDIGDEN